MKPALGRRLLLLTATVVGCAAPQEVTGRRDAAVEDAALVLPAELRPADPAGCVTCNAARGRNLRTVEVCGAAEGDAGGASVAFATWLGCACGPKCGATCGDRCRGLAGRDGGENACETCVATSCAEEDRLCAEH